MCQVTQHFTPTDQWFRLLLAPILLFAAVCADRNYQTDLWHHLARGQITVAEGQLVNTDRFTYTVANMPLRDVNWIWQIAFYWLHARGGISLIQTINAALLGLTLMMVVMYARQRSGSPVVASMVGLVVFLGLWPLSLIRPQTISFLLFVLTQRILDRSSSDRRWLILPPFIMLLWCNIHGGFPIGLVLLASWTLGLAAEGVFNPWADNTVWSIRSALTNLRRLWPWLACLATTFLFSLANPYGWNVYRYVGTTSSAASGRHIDEWLPPGTDTLTGKVFIASLAAFLILLVLPGKRPRLRDAVVLACFLPMAFSAVRMVAWWLFVLAPVLAERIATAWPRIHDWDSGDDRVTHSSVSALAALALLALACLPAFEHISPVIRFTGKNHRIESDLQLMADELQQRPGSRVFSRFAWNEYLGWALAPQYQVFMDGRIEIIPDRIWDQYTTITRGRADWERILDEYCVDHLVLDASGYHHDLLPFVRKSGQWREMTKSGDAVMFERIPATPVATQGVKITKKL